MLVLNLVRVQMPLTSKTILLLKLLIRHLL